MTNRSRTRNQRNDYVFSHYHTLVDRAHLANIEGLCIAAYGMTTLSAKEGIVRTPKKHANEAWFIFNMIGSALSKVGDILWPTLDTIE